MADNPRLQAVNALLNVIGKRKTLDQILYAETQPLVRELVSGSLRHYFSLSQRIDELLTRKLREKDLDVRCLMLVGAYQLLHTRIPDHAAVAETVGCTKALKKPWAKGLVNAVLRNLPSPNEEWSPAALHDHPHWFINLLRNSLPDHWLGVLNANNTRAPMTLRVNQAKVSPASYRELLENKGLDCNQGAMPETLNLEKPLSQKKLPGFADGLVAVQDAAAQLAAIVANPKPNQRVLDACAAPGGKGFHLLEGHLPEGHLPEGLGGINLVMQDISENRITTIHEQAQRLGHSANDALQIRRCDSAQPGNADSDSLYDLILLDAPCSGSGTVRRHPDIKVLRNAEDLQALNNTQSALLDALWPQLAPGGRLIYSTCSLFQEENDAIIGAFIDRSGPGVTLGDLQARVPNHELTPYVAMRHGIQTLPTVDGGDGLYYAELIAPDPMRNEHKP